MNEERLRIGDLAAATAYEDGLVGAGVHQPPVAAVAHERQRHVLVAVEPSPDVVEEDGVEILTRLPGDDNDL